MTRKEAEKQAHEINTEAHPPWFCPLINAMCRKDCVNFVSAFVEKDETNENKGFLHDINDDSFKVDGFRCSNAMFINPESVF